MKKLLLLIVGLPGICMAQPLKLLLPIGHTDMISAVAISSNNRYVVSAAGQTVKVWDMASGKEMLSTTAHRDQVSGLGFLPDNIHFITTGLDSMIKVWNLRTGVIEKEMICKGGRILCAALSKEGKMVVAAANKKIYIIDFTNSLQKEWPSGHKQDIGDIAISEDGEEILTAAYDDPIIWMNLQNGKILRKLSTSPDPKYAAVITRVSFVPGQKKVLVGDRDADASLWDLNTGKPIISYASVYNLPTSYASMASVLTGITAANPIPNSNELWLAREKTIARYNVKTGALQKSIIAHDGDIQTACISNDGHYYITGSNDYTLKLWDAGTGRLLNTFKGHTEAVTGALLSPDKQHAVSFTFMGVIKYWDIRSGELLGNIQEHMGSITSAVFSNSGDLLASCGLDNKVKITDIKKRTTLFTYSIGKPRAVQYWQTEMKEVHFSPDEKELLVVTDTSLQLVDLSKKQLQKAFRFPSHYNQFTIVAARYINQGKEILYGEGYSIFTLDIKTGRSKPIYKSKEGIITHFDLSADEKKLAIVTDKQTVLLVDISGTPSTDRIIQEKETINSIQFSPNAQNLISSSNDGTCKIYETATGQLKTLLKGHDNWVNTAAFSADGANIISSSEDKTVRYWDFQSGKLIASFIAVDESDYITVLEDGTYRGSPKAISLMLFQYNNQVFPFEQFDLKWNRPDKVMTALHHPDTALITIYNKAIDKRLARLGINNADALTDFDLPQIQLPQLDRYPASTTSSSMTISWIASSQQNTLQQVLIKINGIPLRVDLHSDNTNNGLQKKSDSTKLLLSEGMNKIQVSCVNNKGIESLKETFYINYNPAKKTKSKLWYIGIGVSQFADSSRNLQYAAKDIRDLSSVIRQKEAFCEIDTFLNENVTLESIRKIKELLATTNIEDRVILSFSGHGLLNDQQSFYFAPYDQDFNTPSYTRSISYEMIENLLSEIPARKKLLLIDACNSGEIDKEPVQINKTASTEGTVVMKGYQTKGAKVGNSGKSRTSLPNSFELMKTMFADLSQNNGAIVISAAAGNEFALENKKWNNGAFTFCIKKALLENGADKDKNGTSISELKTYVSKMVEQLTNGQQKPTSRQENPDLDWKIW